MLADSRKNQSVRWITQSKTASNTGPTLSRKARVMRTNAVITTAETMKTLPCRSTGKPHRDVVMLSWPIT